MSKADIEVSPRAVMSDPVHFLAFGFGSGLAPVAPGTFGTLAAVPIALLVLSLPPVAAACITVFVCLIGIPICGVSAKRLGVHDYGGIVWDEIAGYILSILPIWAAPALAYPSSPFPLWLDLLLAFGLFRVFDILKPPPIRMIDRQVHGGLGIMLDDLLAGIFSAICLVLIWHIPRLISSMA